MIQRTDVQDAVKRLIRDDAIDMIRVKTRGLTAGAPGQVDAFHYARKKWFTPEYVQATLTDLLVLCQSLEAGNK